MSNRQHDQKASKKDSGDDLTTTLDPSQRGELTLLIADITDSMRNLLLQNFDANAALDQSFLRKGMSEEEKLLSADPKTADVEAMDRQRKLQDENERDLASLKMKNLKKDSLKAFDDWREQVLLRVGEVVNSRDTAKHQLETTSSADAKPEAPTVIGKIIEAPDRGTNLKFKDLYPPTRNPLTKLSMEQRTLILHSVLLLVLSLKHYGAPSRVLLLLLTSSLKLPLKTFEQDEHATAKGLLEGVKELTAEEETKKKAEENKDTRKWKVGLATAAGAAIIGVTGGLAAPLVAAGVGSVMGGLGLGATSAATYLGGVAGSTYLVGGLFGAYGGRMTGNMMDSYAKEVEDFEFLPVHHNQKTSENEKQAVKQASDHDHKLRVSICISGWLTEKEDILKPWRVLGTGAEVFGLKYELEAMLNLGNAINGFVRSAAWGYAKKKVIAATIFADLAAALWPIGLMKAARVIDNPFNIAKSRSQKAGEVLADALINKAQGERPVTLIGYSLGARVIYSCLTSLAQRKAFGLIENAVLVGAPTPSDTSDWRVLRSVVSGRLVNVYSENDYVLGFMYRTSSLQYGIAGLQAVQGLTGVENVDVSDEVSGHLRYRYLMGSILKKIGFEDVDMQAVEEEREALAKMEEEERKKSLEAQRKRLVRRESHGGEEDEGAEAEEEASEIEKEVEAKTKRSMLTKAMEYFYTTPKGPAPENPDMASTDNPEKAKDTVHTQSQIQNSNSPNQSRQSYTSRAAGYLPSMPKSLPSIPGLSSKNDPSTDTQSSTVKRTANVSQQAATSVANTADQIPSPTIKKSLNVRDDQASEAAQNTTKRASVARWSPSSIEGQKDSVVSSAVKSRVNRNIAGTTGDGLKNTSSAVPSSKQAEDISQSYTSYAASYLPSMPKSLPSMPGWSSSRKPPKLEQKESSGVRPPAPKLERKRSSQVKPTQPAQEQRAAGSGPKSPPPKLGPRKTSSLLNPTF